MLGDGPHGMQGILPKVYIFIMFIRSCTQNRKQESDMCFFTSYRAKPTLMREQKVQRLCFWEAGVFS